MKKVSKNLIWGITGQVLILAMGIILPKFILTSFGSEINGITATISQIFTYIALLEAGIGNASINCLYKTLSNNDQNGTSTVISATHKYFKKTIPVYIICILIFAFVYPLCITTEVAPITVRSIILLQGLSGIINFYFSNTYTQLLLADGRNYIISNLTLMVKSISTVLQIILIMCGFDIVSVQFSFLCAYILRAFILNVYVKKKYPWLKRIKNANTNILSQRYSFLIHEISNVVFQSTDIFLISIFCSIKEASVYSIYNMVFAALSGLFAIVFKGIDFNLGIEYHRDKERYLLLHDTYETIYSCFVFSLISAAYIVILPFISLYTNGITDVNYIQPILPVLFALIQLLSCSRAIASKLITIAGHARNTIINSLAEMIINIVSSIILVNFVGIAGVLLGTIVALLYRTVDIIVYANKKILNRSSLRALKTMILNMLIFAGIAICSTKILKFNIQNYFDFFVYGFISLVISLILFFGTHLLIDKNIRILFKTKIKKILNKP